MAKQHSKIRASFYRLIFFCGIFISGQQAWGQELGTATGTSSGVVNPAPQWSAGLQIGSVENTGISAQKYGVATGALNFGLGFWAGDLAVHGDMIWFLTDGFTVLDIASSSGYDAGRGRVLPYAGIGGQIGDGVYVRFPAGLQYTMLKDPINFFGGLTLLIGSDDDDIGIEIGVLLGARVLI